MANLDARQIGRIDRLIRLKATGTPRELALRLGVSERTLYNYMSWLKEKGNCPIAYCRHRGSYYYTRPGGVVLRFVRDSERGGGC